MILYRRPNGAYILHCVYRRKNGTYDATLQLTDYLVCLPVGGKLDCNYLGDVPHESKYKTFMVRLRWDPPTSWPMNPSP